MTRTITAITTLLAATLALGACVTINVNFPQQKIESAASSIEDMVRTPPPPPASTPPVPATPGQPRSEGRGSGAQELRFAPTPAPRSAAAPQWADSGVAVTRGGGVVSVFIPRVAEAQVPELQTQTPEVMAAVASRRERFPRLSTAMAQGCIGENNQGLVQARPGTNCPADVATLVSDENRDRMLIYRTLVQQNNMPPADLARVQHAFAKTNRDRATPGTWVQSPDGQWTRR